MTSPLPGPAAVLAVDDGDAIGSRTATNVSRTATDVAVSAAAMSILSALLVPYGYPMRSLAWAILPCAVGLSVAKRSIRPTPSISAVINDVEAETASPAAPERGSLSTRAVS